MKTYLIKWSAIRKSGIMVVDAHSICEAIGICYVRSSKNAKHKRYGAWRLEFIDEVEEVENEEVQMYD